MIVVDVEICDYEDDKRRQNFRLSWTKQIAKAIHSTLNEYLLVALLG